MCIHRPTCILTDVFIIANCFMCLCCLGFGGWAPSGCRDDLKSAHFLNGRWRMNSCSRSIQQQQQQKHQPTDNENSITTEMVSEDGVEREHHDRYEQLTLCLSLPLSLYACLFASPSISLYLSVYVCLFKSL